MPSLALVLRAPMRAGVFWCLMTISSVPSRCPWMSPRRLLPSTTNPGLGHDGQYHKMDTRQLRAHSTTARCQPGMVQSWLRLVVVAAGTYTPTGLPIRHSAAVTLWTANQRRWGVGPVCRYQRLTVLTVVPVSCPDQHELPGSLWGRWTGQLVHSGLQNRSETATERTSTYIR